MLLFLLSSLAFALPAPVRTAVSVGDCQAVVQQLPKAETDAERFVLGRCLAQSADHSGAIDVLTPVVDGVLGEHARLIRAESELALGRAELALATLDGLKLPSEAGLRARLARARSSILLGRSLDARPDLRALLGTSVRHEALYWLAAGAEDRGDVGPARDAYGDLWAESVRGPWSERAAERLHALGRPTPDPSTEGGRDLMARRVKALEGVYRFGEALEIRRAILAADPEHALGRPYDLARAAVRGRDYPAALALYAKLYGTPERAAGAPGRLFDYALTTSRTGDYDTAAVIYRRLIAQHPGAPEAVSATFKLGYLEVDRGEYKASIPLFQDYLRAHPAGEQADEARWWIGWASLQLGRFDDADRAWKALIEAHPRSSLVPAARYWLARGRGRAGDADGERAGLREVLERHPFSGYAWYAAHKLDHRFPAQAEPERPPWPAALAARPEIARAQTLLQVGLTDAARAELQALVPTARATRDGAVAMAWALIDAGAIRDGQALARPHCGSPQRTADRAAAAACWPRPAWDVVREHSATHGLPPLLAVGIMVTESALDPSVTSLAGARGLMQIMPAESERLHTAVYGERPWHADLLYEPAYNASLGVTELGQKARSLTDAVDGPSIVPAVAAYNGGEAAVRRWVEEQGGRPEFDRFAEQISYTETRRYVRSVLGTTMLYRHVYGDP